MCAANLSTADCCICFLFCDLTDFVALGDLDWWVAIFQRWRLISADSEFDGAGCFRVVVANVDSQGLYVGSHKLFRTGVNATVLHNGRYAALLLLSKALPLGACEFFS